MVSAHRIVWLVVLAAAASALAGDPPAPQPGKETAKPKAAAADAKKPAQPAKPAITSAVVRLESPRTLEDALRILARRRVDVAFDDAPMHDVVEFIARIGRVNAIVSPAFQVKSGSALPAVTLKLRDVSLRQFAELVAKTTGSKLALKDGILQFTTPEDARGEPVLKIYPIQEITFRIRHFPGPDLMLHTGGESQFVQEEESEAESPFDDPQTVVDLIRKTTGEGTWDDEKVSIAADTRKLVVKQYPEVQKEIARLLAVLRAAK